MKGGIDINVKEVLKNLSRATAEIPFATSRAMQIVTTKAQLEAVRTAKRDLDRATPLMLKPEVNKGAIRALWPSKADVKRGFQKSDGRGAQARVFIVGRGDRDSSRLDLIDELHPLVFGGTVRRVPSSSRAVITPSEGLIKGLQGRGRLKKLNKYGNIAGFRNKILRRLKENSKLYLNVPLFNTDKRTQHLPPGLYFKGREISRGGLLRSGERSRNGRLKHTNKNLRTEVRSGAVRRGGRAKVKQNRIRWYLVPLLYYDLQRRYDQQWDFPKHVGDVYSDQYGAEFTFQLQRAIRQTLSRRRR